MPRDFTTFPPLPPLRRLTVLWLVGQRAPLLYSHFVFYVFLALLFLSFGFSRSSSFPALYRLSLSSTFPLPPNFFQTVFLAGWKGFTSSYLTEFCCWPVSLYHDFDIFTKVFLFRAPFSFFFFFFFLYCPWSHCMRSFPFLPNVSLTPPISEVA